VTKPPVGPTLRLGNKKNKIVVMVDWWDRWTDRKEFFFRPVLFLETIYLIPASFVLPDIPGMPS
jgi:hypothetical protein